MIFFGDSLSEKKRYQVLKVTHGATTAQVVRLLNKGWKTVNIAKKLHLDVGSVMAYRANFTLGTYYPVFYPGN